MSIESLGAIFAPSSKQASSNYGVGYDGRIGMYVEERDRSWCTSSSANDNRAVTIEVASDTYDPYKRVLTVHRWFANKSCPGDYLYNLHPQIVTEVNRRLSGGTVNTGTAVSYQVKVTA